MKLGEFLDTWLESEVKPNRAWNTWLSYNQQVNRHIKPRIGNLTLKALKPIKVQQFVAAMQSEGVRSATRQYVVRVLHTALVRAVKLQLIPSAPTIYVDRPKHRKAEIHPFTEDEMQAILADAEGTDPMAAVYELAFSCGPRQGEIFGAYWDDFDLLRKTWHIRRQLVYSAGKKAVGPPKTLRSVRKLELTDRVVLALEERRKWMMREGFAGCEFVFCGRTGSSICPTDFWTRQWKPMLKRLAIEHRGMHHCRHTYATLALGAGVPINVVSYVLGHSNPNTTLRIYAHFLPSQQAQSTEAISRIIG